MDDKEAKAKARAKAKTDLKFGFEKPKIVELGLLGALSSCVIVLIETKSLSGLLRAVESCRQFFQCIDILE